MSAFELTVFSRVGGPLSKHISLSLDGSLKSDGSSCRMTEGVASRLMCDTDNLREFADHLTAMEPNEAIALGTLHSGLPNEVRITTKARLSRCRDAAHLPDGLIARTGESITYRAGCPGLALLDIDVK